MNQTGPQPVEPKNIEAYANMMSITCPEARITLMFHIQGLDIEYCRTMHERIAAENKKILDEAKRKSRR